MAYRRSPVIVIDADLIYDWDSFHSVFAKTCGFPGYYGRNGNAWIDCMRSFDHGSDAQVTTATCDPGEVVTLHIEGATAFATRCPEQYQFLVEGTAFINWARLERGEPSLLALAFVFDPDDPDQPLN
ncbi:MAG: barstar family protein [Kofleriaceae bacterium]